MQQILPITDVRKNLSRLVATVARDEGDVVIVRDSMPEAVLVPYRRVMQETLEKKEAWRAAFTRLLQKGRKAGRQWAKKQNVNIASLNDVALYDLVKKA